jgi:hypothetical protein
LKLTLRDAQYVSREEEFMWAPCDYATLAGLVSSFIVETEMQERRAFEEVSGAGAAGSVDEEEFDEEEDEY